MRLPALILEHPVEALIGGVLLLVVLFGSADRNAAEQQASTVQGAPTPASAERM